MYCTCISSNIIKEINISNTREKLGEALKRLKNQECNEGSIHQFAGIQTHSDFSGGFQ